MISKLHLGDKTLAENYLLSTCYVPGSELGVLVCYLISSSQPFDDGSILSIVRIRKPKLEK